MMRHVRSIAVVLTAIVLVACGSAESISPSVVRADPITLTYAINIPNREAVAYLVRLYPDGIYLSPVDAQRSHDATEVYGRPNVYAGERLPGNAYFGVGIVVAPYAVASKPRFFAYEWPDEFGRPFGGVAPQTEYRWLGRFVYARSRYN